MRHSSPGPKSVCMSVLALWLLLGLSPDTAIAANFFDAFNRADSTNLGADWTETGTGLALSSNRITNPGPDPLPIASAVPASGNNRAEMDVLADPSPTAQQFAALLLLHTDATNTLMVKVRDDNSDGTFDTAIFQSNANSTILSGTSPTAITPFSSGHMRLDVFAGLITLTIDTNGDLIPETTIQHPSSLFTGTGTGVGLGLFLSSADNYSSTTIVPEPASLALTAVAGLARTRRRSAKRP